VPDGPRSGERDEPDQERKGDVPDGPRSGERDEPDQEL
jgi:hypothetical protein